MTADRLKVRCYRCNQLLGVSPTKAGSIVSCPKCKAELLIPGAEPQSKGAPNDVGLDLGAGPGIPAGLLAAGASSAQQGRSGSSPSSPAIPIFIEEVAAGIPPDVAALRPEDLRVEAEFFENLTRERPASTSPEPVTFPFAPDSPDPSSPPAAPAEVPGPYPPLVVDEPVDATSRLMVNPPPLPATDAGVPPIEIEPPTILPPGTVIRRVREVVLPASVVLAWSLFVLVGIAMSFVAGLLIGHYLWKNVP